MPARPCIRTAPNRIRRVARDPPPTVRFINHRNLAENTRGAFHEACALFRKSALDLSKALGPTDDLIEAWGRANSTANVPLWILAHPSLPRELRAWLISWVDNEYAAARSGLVLPSAEDQTNVVSGVLGKLLVAMSSAMVDRVWSADEAREALPIARTVKKHVEILISVLEAVMKGERISQTNVHEIPVRPAGGGTP
jgi:hypothetical protein